MAGNNLPASEKLGWNSVSASNYFGCPPRRMKASPWSLVLHFPLWRSLGEHSPYRQARTLTIRFLIRIEGYRALDQRELHTELDEQRELWLKVTACL